MQRLHMIGVAMTQVIIRYELERCPPTKTQRLQRKQLQALANWNPITWNEKLPKLWLVLGEQARLQANQWGQGPIMRNESTLRTPKSLTSKERTDIER